MMIHRSEKIRGAAVALTLVTSLLCASSALAVRIKDITTVEGVRENQLIGYGLVVGLNDTGDDMGTEFTRQSLLSFLRRHKIQLDPSQVDVGNVAAVMVTANLPPFARQGMKLDVSVSSLGDAESLQGGTLVATYLYPVGTWPEGPVYAVAQGPVSVGGFAAGQSGSSVVKNHPTAGVIPGGALIEREAPTAFATQPEAVLQLRNPDFTTAQRIAGIVNNTFGPDTAQARHAGAVAVRMPAGDTGERVAFLAKVESLEVSPDSPARVVYNERTGTIVMGSKVRISTAIITHGNLIFEQRDLSTQAVIDTIVPGETPIDRQTVVEQQASETLVSEERSRLQVYEEGVTVGEVAAGLNALGVTARDIIAILQALKECGALQAELRPM